MQCDQTKTYTLPGTRRVRIQAVQTTIYILSQLQLLESPLHTILLDYTFNFDPCTVGFNDYTQCLASLMFKSPVQQKKIVFHRAATQRACTCMSRTLRVTPQTHVVYTYLNHADVSQSAWEYGTCSSICYSSPSYLPSYSRLHLFMQFELPEFPVWRVFA